MVDPMGKPATDAEIARGMTKAGSDSHRWDPSGPAGNRSSHVALLVRGNIWRVKVPATIDVGCDPLILNDYEGFNVPHVLDWT